MHECIWYRLNPLDTYTHTHITTSIWHCGSRQLRFFYVGVFSIKKPYPLSRNKRIALRIKNINLNSEIIHITECGEYGNKCMKLNKSINQQNQNCQNLMMILVFWFSNKKKSYHQLPSIIDYNGLILKLFFFGRKKTRIFSFSYFIH